MYTKKNGRMTYKSNRRPNFKRNNNYSSKGRNKGNVTQQYNKYLKLAKDTFSSGDRIQAEYYYQFTDHYYRLMLELGLSLEDQESSDDNKAIESETMCLKFHPYDAEIRKITKRVGINNKSRKEIIKLINNSLILCSNCWTKYEHDLIEFI